MKLLPRLRHEFVRSIPRTLEPGVLYVSLEYATAVHACCCGCGSQVVTPLTPTDWIMSFDGETVSLWPSIGNWNIPCRSHYVISRGRVIEGAPWSKQRIATEQRRDKEAKTKFYASDDALPTSPPGDRRRSADDDPLWTKLTRGVGWRSTRKRD